MAPSVIRVVRLAHVRYSHPDLERAVKFLSDFGMVEEASGSNCVYLRGYGQQPFIYVAEQSTDGKRHSLGGYWVVESETDLQKATGLPGASAVQNFDGPGKGKVVTVPHPNGNTVGSVHGQTLRAEPDTASGTLERETGVQQNHAAAKMRRGAWRRFEIGPSPVHKLGHYGYMVPAEKFKETLTWYTSTLNLKVTDSTYNPKTKEDETCFCHIDLDEAFTDHQSFFVGIGAADFAYVHHSSYEVNDFDIQVLGHDHLRKEGWVNCWGVGRHVLGSQIFDYWFDASGNVIEHYSDGDLVNNKTPVGRAMAAPESLYVWGPNLPLGFVTGRVEDAGKSLTAAPDVVASIPAS